MSEKKGFVSVGTEIAKDLYDKLKKLKEEKKKSMSGIINEALTKYFEEEK